MTDRGQQLLGMYPPFLRGDQTIQAICNAFGGEQVVFDQMMERTTSILFPAYELVDVAHLSLYERILDIPWNPGRTDAQRQATILTVLSRLTMSGSGADWVAVASSIIQSTSWSYTIGGTNNSVVTIRVPALSTSSEAGIMARLLRSITPASVQILVTDGLGFFLDDSLLDVGLL